MLRKLAAGLALAFVAFAAPMTSWAAAPPTKSWDWTVKDFKFRSGESLPELRLHYYTIGEPKRDAQGNIVNAVLLLHGTGGQGTQFLSPQFADVLFTPGGLLDPATTYVIMPDGIGHGRSSKPSDGLRTKFPHYDYADMVEAHHRLVTEHLGVRKLRLILGTSMGCMHGFVWAETYPGDAQALMPMSCLPAELAGRNRLWRKMAIDAIESDPAYKGGDYAEQPVQGLRTAADLLIIAGSAPIQMQKSMPHREDVDAYELKEVPARIRAQEANDLIYALQASRTYNPWKDLEKITAPMIWINFGDDFINPPELGIAEVAAKRLKTTRFILMPASDKTRGHGSHTWAVLWQDELAKLLKRSAH